MTTIDMVIVALYAVGLFGMAQWVSRDSGQTKTTEDYFLAGRTLPWWAIGASLIAANISAEQIIGQSGRASSLAWRLPPMSGRPLSYYWWSLNISFRYFETRNLHHAAVLTDALRHGRQVVDVFTGLSYTPL